MIPYMRVFSEHECMLDDTNVFITYMELTLPVEARRRPFGP